MSNYHERVLQGRKQFLRLVIEQEKELLSIYEEAAKQVAYKLSKYKPGGLTVRYLSELDKTINQYINELRGNLVETIKDGIEASSQIASAIQLSYFENIDPREDILATFNKMFTQLPSSIVKQLINGSYYADGKTLNNRIRDLISKNASDIDRLIKINVAKGVNARELAKQLNEYINPTKKIDAKTLEVGMNKNISYQAQRLGRTSLTHAHNETYIKGSKMNPFCRGLKWNLSPSHYERQVKKWGQDICDEYATRDSYSRGQGVYPADKYPVAHPNCLCYPTQGNAPVERAREEIIKWLNGGSNTLLDQWSDKYGEEFGIERNKSKAFSEIAASKGENSGIITSKRDGKVRAEEFSKYWQEASLRKVIEKFAPDFTISEKLEKGKILYKSNESDIQIVYDTNGNYFRIEDLNIRGKRRYLDINGDNAANKLENGKQKGRSKEEYEALTHFKNKDGEDWWKD